MVAEPRTPMKTNHPITVVRQGAEPESMAVTLVDSSIAVVPLEPLVRAQVRNNIAAVLAAARIPEVPHIHTEHNSTAAADNSTQAAGSSTDGSSKQEEDTMGRCRFRSQWEGRCQF